MFVLTIWGVLSPAIREWRQRKKSGETRTAGTFGFRKTGLDADLLFTLVLTGLFITSLVISSQWEFGAKLVPQVVGWTFLIIISIYVFFKLFYQKGRRQAEVKDGSGQTVRQDVEETDVHFDIVVDFGDIDIKTIWNRALVYFGWCFFFFGAASIIGLLPAMFVFLVGYMRFSGQESWKLVLGISIPLWAFCYFLFHEILIIPWPQTGVGDMFPVLRTINAVNLF
jgi:hypothetical protein